MGGKALNAGVVGISAAPDGKGYWEVASDGGIFAFGDAGHLGSAHYTGPTKAAPNSAAFYANQILANPRITTSYSPTIRADLQDAAAGRPGTAASAGCHPPATRVASGLRVAAKTKTRPPSPAIGSLVFVAKTCTYLVAGAGFEPATSGL